MNALIRLLYALLIAGTVVAFAALTVYSFYQPPKYPKAPDYPQYPALSYNQSQAEIDRQQKAYDTEYNRLRKIDDKAVDSYHKKQKSYYRNVTITLLPLAALASAAGIYLMRRRSEVVGEGLALGGVAISIYAIIMASLADARVLRFIAACVLLATVLSVAYFRFPKAKSPKHQLPL